MNKNSNYNKDRRIIGTAVITKYYILYEKAEQTLVDLYTYIMYYINYYTIIYRRISVVNMRVCVCVYFVRQYTSKGRGQKECTVAHIYPLRKLPATAVSLGLFRLEILVAVPRVGSLSGLGPCTVLLLFNYPQRCPPNTLLLYRNLC